MIWQDASLLWLLLLIPVMAGIIWWTGYRRVQRLNRYFDDRLIGQLRRGFWQPGQRLKLIFLLTSFFFFIVGLAGPRIGTEVRDIEQQGIDMLILLDLSRSMNAEDIRPSRLEKAKFEIQRVIERSRSDRIGLLVFTGAAFVQSPMTQDHSALLMFLDIAESDQMPNTTTRFSAAMEKAKETFDRMDERRDAARVVLLISDGEDQGEDFTGSLDALKGEEVIVFTVGVGTTGGGRIPVYEEETSYRIGYHRDPQGREVVSRLEPNVLREIAAEGSGSYYQIDSSTSGIDQFLARMDDLQRGEYSSQEYADYRNRYQFLLLIGLALFVTGLIIPEYRKR